MEKLQELRQNLASLDDQMKQAKADMSSDDKYTAMFEYLYQSISRTREYLYELEDALYNHSSPSNGHIPKIKGAGKMEGALKALGISEDYEVQKPTIYARATRAGNPEFSIELKTPKSE